MKFISSFFRISALLLVTLPAMGQTNSNFLRNYDLVDLPFGHESNLLGALVDKGRLITILPKDRVPEFEESTSLEDLIFEKDSTRNINAGATIFNFINARFKAANSQFKLTQIPNIRIIRAKDVPMTLQGLGLNSGKIITGYLVADGFTFCSDKVDEIIAQAQLVGGSTVTPSTANVERKCQDLSQKALAAVSTGSMPVSMPTPTTPSKDITSNAAEKATQDISQLVQEAFAKIGLQNVSASVDLRSHTVTIAKTTKPVVIAWQLVKYDPRKSSDYKLMQGKFMTSNVTMLNDRSSPQYDRTKPTYQIFTGEWDEKSRENNNLSRECVFFEVTDIGSGYKLPRITYCPQTDEIPDISRQNPGYVRNQNYLLKSQPLANFVRGTNIVKPRFSISKPIFAFHSIDGVKLFADIQIDETTSPFQFVKK